jgi:hypothetical protein
VCKNKIHGGGGLIAIPAEFIPPNAGTVLNCVCRIYMG